MPLESIDTFQNGAEAVRRRLNAVDPGKNGYNEMFGEPGLAYPERPQHEVEGTIRKLIDGYNDYVVLREVILNRPF